VSGSSLALAHRCSRGVRAATAGIYLRCFFSLQIQKSKCFLSAGTAYFSSSSLSFYLMEKNTYLFKVLNPKYLLKPVQLVVLYLPLFYRLL